MNSLTQRKKVELRLIADLTLDAMLAAEEKLSRLARQSKNYCAFTKKKVC